MDGLSSGWRPLAQLHRAPCPLPAWRRDGPAPPAARGRNNGGGAGRGTRRCLSGREAGRGRPDHREDPPRVSRVRPGDGALARTATLAATVMALHGGRGPTLVETLPRLNPRPVQ